MWKYALSKSLLSNFFWLRLDWPPIDKKQAPLGYHDVKRAIDVILPVAYSSQDFISSAELAVRTWDKIWSTTEKLT